MFDFSAIITEVLAIMTSFQGLIVATTMVGGVIAAKLGGNLGFSFLRKLISLAR